MAPQMSTLLQKMTPPRNIFQTLEQQPIPQEIRKLQQEHPKLITNRYQGTSTFENVEIVHMELGHAICEAQ